MLSINKDCGKIFWLRAGLLLLSFVSACCAGAPAEIPSKLKPIAPCPALVSAAETNRIPLAGTDSLSAATGLNPGDSVTILGTLEQKGNRTQWVLYIEAAAAGAKKAPAKKSEPLSINAFGTPMKFESKPVAAKLRMLGPFTVTSPSKQSKAQVRTAEFFLNESFLSLGFEQAAAVMAGWNEQTNFESATSLIASPTSRTNKPSHRELTFAEKRGVIGAVPALMSYFDIVQNTDGLEEILSKLVEKPSLWSIIRHLGVQANFSFGGAGDGYPVRANPSDWSLPASASVYYFPWSLRLNDTPALKVTFVVTTPDPPLLICGGVVGLLAEKVGDEETYMTLRVISAKRTTK